MPTLVNVLGPERAKLRRSARGIAVGLGAVLAIFGALAAWNLIIRPGPRAALMLVVLGGVAVIAFLGVLASPHTISIREGGVVVLAWFKAPLGIRWEEIIEVRVSRAAWGKRPRVVQVEAAGVPGYVIASEREHEGVDALLLALRARVAERIVEEQSLTSPVR